MPGFNQKGPMGQGPMTGRRMGQCTNFGAGRKNQIIPENIKSENQHADEFPEQGFGRGFGNGMGRGQGWRGGRGPGWKNRFRGGQNNNE